MAFFESLSAGHVASHLDSDLVAVQAGVSEKVGLVIQSVAYLVTAYAVAFVKDPELAAMLLNLFPAYFIMAFVGSHLFGNYRAEVEKSTVLADSLASESLANIKLVKAFRAAPRIQAIFDGYLAAASRPAMGKIVTSAVQMGLLYFIAYSANALAFSQGGRQIADAKQGVSSSVSLGAVYTVMVTLIDGILASPPSPRASVVH